MIIFVKNVSGQITSTCVERFWKSGRNVKSGTAQEGRIDSVVHERSS